MHRSIFVTPTYVFFSPIFKRLFNRLETLVRYILCRLDNIFGVLLFDRTSRRHRSHGSRKYNKPEIHNVSFDGFLPFVNLQLGLHHIRTRLYSLPLNMLHDLYESTLTLHFTDAASPEHRLQSIILDISSNRLFKAVSVCDNTETKNRPFLKIKFANKGIDALNFSNILNKKSVQSNIPPYFQNKESPCISYSYTRSVASKIFNYKRSLQQIDFNSLSQNPLPCTCPGSEFLYAPCGHVVTGDLSIVQNDKLRDLLRKGPKFREPVSFSWHQNFDIIMDACEAYARQWAKKEDVELDTLSEWIKSIGEVVKRRIRRLKHSVNTRSESICRDPDVVRELSRLHENFVIVPADKASNNYTFVCKRHYVDILIEQLGLHSLPGNPTYNLTDFSASEVLDNHKSVLTSFGVQSNSEEFGLPYIYWIPKMHKNPYKHRFIAGSSKCSTKPLSIILTKLLTHIKQGLQKYCETAYSRSGVNQMWILKNSKELLDHLKSPNFNLITNIKSFDFSTLYTTIPHQKLKSRLATIIQNSFLHKNGNRRYKYLVLGREGPYFVKEHSDAKNKYTEEDIIKMLQFLVDNIFVVFAGKVFQQIVGIPMGTNCAPLLADIFLYSYEAEFIQSLLSAGKKRLASQFNFTYTSTTFCPLITQTLRIISVRCIPLSLRSKTRRRATLLLPTWICSCQSAGTVNFALPLTTNVTISISILQTFRSWVATSHLRPPMAFLSHNSSDTPGLAPLMNVLFWGRCDFPISFSGRDMSRNVWNRL